MMNGGRASIESYLTSIWSMVRPVACLMKNA